MTAAASFIEQILTPPEEAFTPALARHILAIDFSREEHLRANLLSEKATEGTLTENEQIELERLVNADVLLGTLQSRARVYLKNHSPTQSNS